MSDATWQGINRPASFKPEIVARANALSDAARDYRWETVLSLLSAWPEGINSPRLGGASGFAPLHQAAYGGAPLEVVEALLARGAFRLLQTTDGERPVNLARQYGHTHLLAALEPVRLLTFPASKLAKIEAGVHQVIRGREHVGSLLDEHEMRLPPIEVLTEIPSHDLWFPVPGMYGGFHLRLGGVADEPVCLVDSWVRVVGGSEERRLVSTGGITELYIPLS